eukprot:gene12266-14376_t
MKKREELKKVAEDSGNRITAFFEGLREYFGGEEKRMVDMVKQVAGQLDQQSNSTLLLMDQFKQIGEQSLAIEDIRKRVVGVLSPVIKALDDIYCIGGSSTSLSTMIYSVSENKWRQGPDMQTPRPYLSNAFKSMIAAETRDQAYSVSGAATFIHRGTLYTLGGYTNGSPNRKITAINLQTLEITTFIENVFTNYQRTSVSFSCFDGQEYLYILGRSVFIRVSILSKRIKRLVPPSKLNTWSDYHHNLVYCGNRGYIYLIFKQSAYYYNISTDQWQEIAKPPVTLINFGAVEEMWSDAKSCLVQRDTNIATEKQITKFFDDLINLVIGEERRLVNMAKADREMLEESIISTLSNIDKMGLLGDTTLQGLPIADAKVLISTHVSFGSLATSYREHNNSIVVEPPPPVNSPDASPAPAPTKKGRSKKTRVEIVPAPLVPVGDVSYVSKDQTVSQLHEQIECFEKFSSNKRKRIEQTDCVFTWSNKALDKWKKNLSSIARLDGTTSSIVSMPIVKGGGRPPNFTLPVVTTSPPAFIVPTTSTTTNNYINNTISHIINSHILSTAMAANSSAVIVPTSLLPEAPSMAPPVVTKIEELMFVGGQKTPVASYIYTTATNTWRQGEVLPTPNPHPHCAINTGTAIYLFGGSATGNSFERFNLSTRKWDFSGETVTQLFQPMALCFDNLRYIYLFGGRHHDALRPFTDQSKLSRLDTHTNITETMSDTLYPMGQAHNFYHQGKIYICSNYNINKQFPKVAILSMLDITTLKTDELIDQVFPAHKSDHVGSICFDGEEFMYILSYKSRFIRVSIKTKETTYLAQHPCTSECMGNLIYCSQSKRMYHIYVRYSYYYDIQENAWKEICKPPISLRTNGVVGL